MVRGGTRVGALAPQPRVASSTSFAWGRGGARGALGAVLQARLLAQGNVLHQFGAAATLPFFLPPPDLGLLRGTNGPGKGSPVAGPQPLPRLFHGCKERRFLSPQYLVSLHGQQFAGVGDGVGMDDWGTAASAGIHARPLDERVAVGGGK